MQLQNQVHTVGTRRQDKKGRASNDRVKYDGLRDDDDDNGETIKIDAT